MQKQKAQSRQSKNKKRQDPDAFSAQTLAIILFAAALLLFFIVIIPGENVWNLLHKFILGLFGKSAILWPISLVYIAVIASLEKPKNYINTRVLISGLTIIFICTAVYVFTATSYGGIENYISNLTNLYIRGTQGQGAGFFSGILGIPLILAVGLIGSKIIILILLFVSLMFLTGVTLINLIRGIKKPVDTAVRNIGESIEIKRKKRQTAQIDIPLPQHPVKSSRPPIIEVEGNEKFSVLQEAISNNVIPPEPTSLSDSSALEAAMAFAQTQKKKKKEPVLPMELEMQNPESDSYKFPPVWLLEESPSTDESDITNELQSNGQMLVDTLKNFGVETRITNISRGPAVTRYELQPAAGVKISKITNLADDIALNLAASGVRIEAPIPGKAAVGIEIPNKIISIVKMRELILSKEFTRSESKLSVVLGRDIAGNAAIADLSKMPHLLIAGSTGSGKSVCINSFIVSLLYKATPDEVRFLMIDPKVVELGMYNGIPHLLVPVVTDPRKAAGALSWAVNEMLKRYKIFAEHNVRDLPSYNRMMRNKIKALQKNEESDKKGSIFSKMGTKPQEDEQKLELMPQIVIIIDELADLMMAAPNEVEDSICRLAQMARAAGMHLLIATQRPSVDVITGIIKANIPSRIALAVSSQVDSRTILDSTGAEKLLGRGDMLFSPIGVQKPIRIQGCFVTDVEIESVVDTIKEEQINDYDQDVIEEIERNAVLDKTKDGISEGDENDSDPMLQEAIKCIIECGQASTSLLQRRLRLGYARAGRLIDEMEQKGIIGPYEGSKPRQILITKQQYQEMITSS